MMILYFLFVILCVGMTMVAINERSLLDALPWIISLILTMKSMNDEVDKDNDAN